MSDLQGMETRPSNLELIKRELLMRRLKQQPALRVQKGTMAPIPRADRTRGCELSWAQERIWFLSQLEGVGEAYHMTCLLRLRGVLDHGVLQAGLNTLVERHESLRTTFISEEGRPLQVTHPSQSLLIDYVDLSDQGPDVADAQARQLAQQLSRRAYCFEQGPLIRCQLVCLTDEQHLLTIAMHHIISDGWSLNILMNELAALYSAYLQGADNSLKSLAIQYGDYAVWQRSALSSELLNIQLDYWKSRLEGAPATLELPADFPRPAIQSFTGNTHTVVLASSDLERARQLGKDKGWTTFMIMLATLQLLLARWSGQNDIVVGTVTAGRNRSETESLVGCFMNFLPLRGHVDYELSVEAFLRQTHEHVVTAFTYQECPFEKIVEAINPVRNVAYNPLFNVGFLLQNYRDAVSFSQGSNNKGGAGEPSLVAEIVDLPVVSSLLDLRFVATEEGDGIKLSCEYNTQLFEEKSIKDLLGAYQLFFSRLVSSSTVPLASFKLGAPLVEQVKASRKREKKLHVNISSSFTADYIFPAIKFWSDALGSTAVVNFSPYNQVIQTLLNPAGIFSNGLGDLNVCLLRLEDWLNSADLKSATGPSVERMTEQLQSHLLEFVHAVKTYGCHSTRQLVLLCCPCSDAVRQAPQLYEALASAERHLSEQVSSMSNVHCVLSPALIARYPALEWNDSYAEELAHVPYTSEAFVVLGESILRHYHALSYPPYKVIVLDCDNTLWSGVCGEVGAEGVLLDEPSETLQRFMRDQLEQGMLLCLCSKNVEEDVWEVFSKRKDFPLQREHFVGARINWQPKSENILSLARELNLGVDSFIFIDDNPVECAEVLASLPDVLTFNLPADRTQTATFLQGAWAFDKVRVTDDAKGRAAQYVLNKERDALRKTASNFQEFLAGLEIKVNLGEMREEQRLRIAELTQRTNQFNLSTRRRSVAEIENLQNEKELTFLTAQVEDRFGDYGLTGGVFYRACAPVLELDTFLLSCRVLGKGVEYIILNKLATLALEQACRYIIAPYLPSAKNEPVHNFLISLGAISCTGRDRVTHYFVIEAREALTARYETGLSQEGGGDLPSLVVAGHTSHQDARTRVENLRRISEAFSVAGSVLSHIEKNEVAQTSCSRQAFVCACTPIEVEMEKIWCRVLGIDRVSREDNFFEIGGHSLLVIRLYQSVRDKFGVTLPMSTIFTSPSLRAFSNLLEAPSIKHSLLTPLGGIGEQRIFFIHPAGGTVFGYRPLAQRLPQSMSAFAIQSPEVAGYDLADYTLESLCECYVEVINEFYPVGKLRLAGWSLGGKIAFRMAMLFESRGREVEWLGLFDSGFDTDFHDSHEAFLASVFLHLNADDLMLDPDLRAVLTRVQAFARTIEGDFEHVIRENPEWLLEHGVADHHLEFLHQQYLIQRAHAALDSQFEPHAINAPLHVVWAADSLHSKESTPMDWLLWTKDKSGSTQMTLHGRHSNVITLPENIDLIIKSWT
ncbi:MULTISPECIES: HAD-IIIC family phosphatase [Gammaproteobacteria]|uniref:HAD-IIIC family phosphatase n=1 Tax=Gammaproteobacteria TaxID=1236 RepID=UPI00191305B1|nr:HAD-IIIC family phosphatase [Bacillus sp. TH86]MBK5312929.1 HAD-IIIC family phosphatase [Pseudomonas sp. TH71]MBK5318426.1 HAD-IIIC family phosphatase [Erwinia sp. TH79]MBK5323928.1 HAD-IIIC family phosphatase [Bacillus sp. TH59]MBK5338878.1 HAD-IIIC family phosphatase [Bacillus sp. TH57]MBK5372133.1 HAD-IIIC family phosphatase [Pseudomonas sp. TH40]MBK5383302.1 HAD-IIIC family phosphatase [Pseudomonas sp. TH35]MBK5388761.1 HAD-IIIC family phosphatase [Pseudomonas sp. TH38]MBK5406056.1 H